MYAVLNAIEGVVIRHITKAFDLAPLKALRLYGFVYTRVHSITHQHGAHAHMSEGLCTLRLCTCRPHHVILVVSHGPHPGQASSVVLGGKLLEPMRCRRRASNSVMKSSSSFVSCQKPSTRYGFPMSPPEF